MRHASEESPRNFCSVVCLKLCSRAHGCTLLVDIRLSNEDACHTICCSYEFLCWSRDAKNILPTLSQIDRFPHTNPMVLGFHVALCRGVLFKGIPGIHQKYAIHNQSQRLRSLERMIFEESATRVFRRQVHGPFEY